LLQTDTITRDGEKFIKAFETKINSSNKDYIKAIQNLDAGERKTGSNWMRAIEHHSIEKFLL
jgi:hypothetical protein